MGALLDTTPAAPPPAAPPWRPAPAPGAWQLFTDNLRLHADGLAAAVAALGDPAPVVDRLGSRVRQMRLLAGEGRAPRLSLNQPAGRRRLLIARADLTQAKAAAHAHGATVNDVVLAAPSSGPNDPGRAPPRSGKARRWLRKSASDGAFHRSVFCRAGSPCLEPELLGEVGERRPSSAAAARR
jgi:hypothetical protein